MSSRSIVSASSLLLFLALLAAPAHAGRRVVVLEFSGPKAERFHEDVTAALKKAKHTVVPVDDWMEKADDLGASKVNARNIQKVARKLKVEGVIVGDVEKRGKRYYVHLRLREGVSGEYVAEVEIVVRQGKLGSEGNATLKEELLPAIKELSKLKGRSDPEDEEEEEEPRKKKKKKSGFSRDDDEDVEDEEEEEEEEDEPVAKKKSKKDKKDKKGKKSKKTDEDEDDEEAFEDEEEEERVSKKSKKAKKAKKAKKVDDEEDEEELEDDEDDEDRVALSEDDEEEIRIDEDDRDDRGSDEDVVESPLMPALDVGAGLSVTTRRLAFQTAAGAAPVQGYRGNPVAGAVITADVYPLAFNKKNRSITRNLGLTVHFDRVVRIESRLQYDDGGTTMTATLGTTQQRYSAGVLYRMPVGEKIAVVGSVRYSRMTFAIDKDAAPPGVTIQIPNVDYTFVDPGVQLRYLVNDKLVVGGGGSVGLVLGTGEMQTAEQYGDSSVLGIDLGAGAAYHVTPDIVIRGDLRLTTFGFSFNGSGAMSDPNDDGTVDVPGGRDSYFGAAATAAYQF